MKNKRVFRDNFIHLANGDSAHVVRKDGSVEFFIPGELHDATPDSAVQVTAAALYLKHHPHQVLDFFQTRIENAKSRRDTSEADD
jgi:hypothetical protein